MPPRKQPAPRAIARAAAHLDKIDNPRDLAALVKGRHLGQCGKPRRSQKAAKITSICNNKRAPKPEYPVESGEYGQFLKNAKMSENKDSNYEIDCSLYPHDSVEVGIATSPDKSPTSPKCTKKRTFLTPTTSHRPLIESVRYAKMVVAAKSGSPLESAKRGLHCNKKRDFDAWVNPLTQAMWNQQAADLGSKKRLVENAKIGILRVFVHMRADARFVCRCL